MDFKRVDEIEKEWIRSGKKLDIDYVWLAHGKYIRKNSDFNLKLKLNKQTSPKQGFEEVRETIFNFYKKYIFNKETEITGKNCYVTGGCRDGVKAALNYFKKFSEGNVLFLVPTYQPLVEIAKNIFPESKIFYLKHFNEKYDNTLSNIEEIIKEKFIKCIVLTNPNNPAGIMYPEPFVSELGRICNRYNILIIEDGAYFLHYSKEHQTSVLLYSDYSISNITAYKLLLSKDIKVGGTVLSNQLDVDEYSMFTKSVPANEQIWFKELLTKVSLETPEILQSHLEEIFQVSNIVTNLFYKAGFLPLYKSIEGEKTNVSIGPVTSLTYLNKVGEKVDSEILFNKLKKYDILTTPMEEGIRINSRGIKKRGINLLSLQLKKIKQELALLI
jgi:hypothetical protein